jgi:hypothetical protein
MLTDWSPLPLLTAGQSSDIEAWADIMYLRSLAELIEAAAGELFAAAQRDELTWEQFWALGRFQAFGGQIPMIGYTLEPWPPDRAAEMLEAWRAEPAVTA